MIDTSLYVPSSASSKSTSTDAEEELAFLRRWEWAHVGYSAQSFKPNVVVTDVATLSSSTLSQALKTQSWSLIVVHTHEPANSSMAITSSMLDGLQTKARVAVISGRSNLAVAGSNNGLPSWLAPQASTGHAVKQHHVSLQHPAGAAGVHVVATPMGKQQAAAYRNALRRHAPAILQAQQLAGTSPKSDVQLVLGVRAALADMAAVCNSVAPEGHGSDADAGVLNATVVHGADADLESEFAEWRERVPDAAAATATAATAAVLADPYRVLYNGVDYGLPYMRKVRIKLTKVVLPEPEPVTDESSKSEDAAVVAEPNEDQPAQAEPSVEALPAPPPALEGSSEATEAVTSANSEELQSAAAPAADGEQQPAETGVAAEPAAPAAQESPSQDNERTAAATAATPAPAPASAAPTGPKYQTLAVAIPPSEHEDTIRRMQADAAAVRARLDAEEQQAAAPPAAAAPVSAAAAAPLTAGGAPEDGAASGDAPAVESEASSSAPAPAAVPNEDVAMTDASAPVPAPADAPSSSPARNDASASDATSTANRSPLAADEGDIQAFGSDAALQAAASAAGEGGSATGLTLEAILAGNAKLSALHTQLHAFARTPVFAEQRTVIIVSSREALKSVLAFAEAAKIPATGDGVPASYAHVATGSAFKTQITVLDGLSILHGASSLVSVHPPHLRGQAAHFVIFDTPIGQVPAIVTALAAPAARESSVSTTVLLTAASVEALATAGWDDDSAGPSLGSTDDALRFLTSCVEHFEGQNSSSDADTKMFTSGERQLRSIPTTTTLLPRPMNSRTTVAAAAAAPTGAQAETAAFEAWQAALGRAHTAEALQALACDESGPLRSPPPPPLGVGSVPLPVVPPHLAQPYLPPLPTSAAPGQEAAGGVRKTRRELEREARDAARRATQAPWHVAVELDRARLAAAAAEAEQRWAVYSKLRDGLFDAVRRLVARLLHCIGAGTTLIPFPSEELRRLLLQQHLTDAAAASHARLRNRSAVLWAGSQRLAGYLSSAAGAPSRTRKARDASAAAAAEGAAAAVAPSPQEPEGAVGAGAGGEMEDEHEMLMDGGGDDMMMMMDGPSPAAPSSAASPFTPAPPKGDINAFINRVVVDQEGVLRLRPRRGRKPIGGPRLRAMEQHEQELQARVISFHPSK
jgi:hypothetical protein